MMPNVEMLPFRQAVEETEGDRILLLGNGFSIACFPDIFRYERLFEQAEWEGMSPESREAFALLGTSDFEKVIRALKDAASLARAYGLPEARVASMMADAEALKELLVRTIADSHPEHPGQVTDEKYQACLAFLGHFKTIYTVNYDLLLYWTQMHREQLNSDDGFRTSQADIDAGAESDYVVWESGQSHDQNMWFLHGALHVFDSGTEVKKYTWQRTGVRLIEQTRQALEHDFFPLFVAEGTSNEKLERIRHSDYLAKAYRSFESIRKPLFILGHSLAENDEHYLRLIERGRVEQLFVGLHGDPNGERNQAIVRRANRMSEVRGNRHPLTVRFFDSGSAHVWG